MGRDIIFLAKIRHIDKSHKTKIFGIFDSIYSAEKYIYEFWKELNVTSYYEEDQYEIYIKENGVSLYYISFEEVVLNTCIDETFTINFFG